MIALNNKLTDIYIGDHAGVMINKDIEAARKRVYILSPYVTDLMGGLLHKWKSGVDVKLITDDKFMNDVVKMNRNVEMHAFIEQTTIITGDESTYKWYGYLKSAMKYLAVLDVISIAPALYFHKNITPLLVGAVLFPILSYIFHMIRKNTQLYSYKYDKMFPFTVYVNPHGYKDGTKINETYAKDRKYKYIHSKIFLIDDIVYLGSVNYTWPGLKYNFETRIRTTDPEVISRINLFFKDIEKLKSEGVGFYDLPSLGKFFYHEPIN